MSAVRCRVNFSAAAVGANRQAEEPFRATQIQIWPRMRRNKYVQCNSLTTTPMVKALVLIEGEKGPLRAKHMCIQHNSLRGVCWCCFRVRYPPASEPQTIAMQMNGLPRLMSALNKWRKLKRLSQKSARSKFIRRLVYACWPLVGRQKGMPIIARTSSFR